MAINPRRLLAAGLIAGASLLLAGCSSSEPAPPVDAAKPQAESARPAPQEQPKEAPERPLHTLTEANIAAIDAAVNTKFEECGGSFDFHGDEEFSIDCAVDPASADFTGSLTDAPVAVDAGDGSEHYDPIDPTREAGVSIYLSEPDIVSWRGGIFLSGAGQSGVASGRVDLGTGELITIALNY